MRLLFLITFSTLLCSAAVSGQASRLVSEDEEGFKDDLIRFMGVNLTSDQEAVKERFLTVWDSIAMRTGLRQQLHHVTNQYAGRGMRPAPDFIRYMRTITAFTSTAEGADRLSGWLGLISGALSNPNIDNEEINRFLEASELIVKERLLFRSGAVRWRLKVGSYSFEAGNSLKLVISNADIICYSQGDSTAIWGTSGNYYPGSHIFYGDGGRVTWEKAGYSPDQVYATLPDSFTINMRRNSYTADSVYLYHNGFFDAPVAGKLTDQAYSVTGSNRMRYPKFETYVHQFEINNIYEEVNYQGGLTFEGEVVMGNGTPHNPARLSLFRNDTLYIVTRSVHFMLMQESASSLESSMTLYLDKDSIYHSNLGFSYSSTNREVSFFRTDSPVSRSPYSNSYHNIDMYFESLQWDMNEPQIRMSRARGASIGTARFESHSFFRRDQFERMLYFDDVHPLYSLRAFAEAYYSETFPIAEFARWLGKPYENVVSMCIELSNRGFLFFDRSSSEVTITDKVGDYISFFGRGVDYDIISFSSEVNAPLDNAILDLRNSNITINGVPRVFLSDSQSVAIFPYNRQMVLTKGRNFTFDGVVAAGLFTIYGHNFSFSYDSFMIDLADIDSIKIAVETGQYDWRGNAVIEEIDNLIQLGSAELFIDAPNNKSGLRGLRRYPIISTTTDSYIFFDRIPGLEGIYAQDEFYFRVDPFTYENIDRYKIEDLNLTGTFHGGEITGSFNHTLIIQPDNSLGVSYHIPSNGIPIYDGKGVMFDYIGMSNEGMRGRGTIERLGGRTGSEEFFFYPDSVIADATQYSITASEHHPYPDLLVEDVKIEWLTDSDELYVYNTPGNRFDIYFNNTMLDGHIVHSPDGLAGAGVIERPDSRLISDHLYFSISEIRADSSDYQLISPSGDGLAFVAENASATIDFSVNETRFNLNTDSSLVRLPEVEFICTMTDFTYDMEDQILHMNHAGAAESSLISPEDLTAIEPDELLSPTFFATNRIRDTIKFHSASAYYNLESDEMTASGISYIPVADALIQPPEGTITVGRRGVIRELKGAVIAINNRHLLHSGNITIESVRSYTGSATYNYITDAGDVYPIYFSEIRVDTLRSGARGYVSIDDQFMLNRWFSFNGDVRLNSLNDHLLFNGAAGINHNCNTVFTETIRFRSEIDPRAVMIPVSDTPRDINENMIFSGTYINTDSTHIYPAFLSRRKSWSDTGIITAEGYLYFDESAGIYRIADISRIVDNSLPGNMVTFDHNYCLLYSEGAIDFGADYDLFLMSAAGNISHDAGEGEVKIRSVIGLEFHFSDRALSIMASDIRGAAGLEAVNIRDDFNMRGMADMFGTEAASTIAEQLGLFGTVRNMPSNYKKQLLINDVTLVWNEESSSFRSTGKIGVGFIGNEAINVYMDGYIEIQRRRAGDMFDIYLKTDDSNWYYFSYFRGNLMTLSSNSTYNTTITEARLRDRRHPESTTRRPFIYMISVDDRLRSFLRRMEEENEEYRQ